MVPPLVACAAKPANVEDLRRAILVLDTYADRTIAEFADFLTRCEEFARTGIVPVVAAKAAPKSREPAKPKEPKMTVEEGLALARDLYERALSDDTTYDAIDAELKALDSLGAKDAKAVAKEFGVASSGTMKATVAAIGDKIRRRKGTQTNLKGID